MCGSTPVGLFGIHDRDTAKVRNATYFGLKVFMDAHDTVTVEEGDRYPLRPPSFVSVDVEKAGTRNPCELSVRQPCINYYYVPLTSLQLQRKYW